MNTFNVPCTYDQLVMLSQLLNRWDVKHSFPIDAEQLRAFVQMELARAHALTRQCLDCG